MAEKKNEGINFFQKYLTIWVFICMVVGVIIGKLLPAIPNALGNLEISGISIPIAILIWIMIYPMMLKVDFQSIKQVGRNPKGLFITWITNWLIKPFTMYGIASLFLFTVFKGFIAPELATQYLAGAVLLGAAPCTAMVFVWSTLTKESCIYCGTGGNKRLNHTDCICANSKVFTWSIKCISTLRNIVFQCDSVCGDSTCWGCINKNSCS